MLTSLCSITSYTDFTCSIQTFSLHSLSSLVKPHLIPKEHFSTHNKVFISRLRYNVVMALRGWRLFGVAGTIFAYVAGILLLSVLSLNNPNQRRGRSGRFGEVGIAIIRFVIFILSFKSFHSSMHSDTVKSI